MQTIRKVRRFLDPTVCDFDIWISCKLDSIPQRNTLAVVPAWTGAAKSLDFQFSPLAKAEPEKEKRVKKSAKESVLKMSGIHGEYKGAEN